jgi:NADH:ubiquinone oxidoreductase subunit E
MEPKGGLSMRVMALVFTAVMALCVADSAFAAGYSTNPSRDHQFVNGCGGGSCYRSGSQKIQHAKHHKVVK